MVKEDCHGYGSGALWLVPLSQPQRVPLEKPPDIPLLNWAWWWCWCGAVVPRDVCLEMFLIWRPPIMITHCRTHHDGYRDVDSDVHADCVNYSYHVKCK